MSCKKWAIAFVAIVVAFSLLMSGATILLDPLVRYRSENEGLLTYYKRSEMYTNPGVARNYDYDSVLLGTSMMHHTNVSELNAINGGNTVKLTYSGGTAYNMKQVLDICFKSDNEIKTVYWALDEAQFNRDSDTTRHPLPDYLYKENYFDDLNYLLNGDIFFRYTAPCLLNTLLGKEKTMLLFADENSKNNAYGAEQVLSSFELPKQKHDGKSIENAKANLKKNIIPFIEANPNTEFVFMFVPYSVLYWYREMEMGSYEDCIKSMELVIKTLLEYDNVSLYYFRNETDITTNLDNYRDYSHYSPEINSYMINAISKGENKLTKENYKQELESFDKFTSEFDYEGFISEYKKKVGIK